MKKAIFYLLACVLLPVAASADEGMWLVSTFRDVIYPQMKKEGLKLKPGEIYNEESPALCNAIVAVGGGMGNMGAMMKQAQKMQVELARAQEEIKDMTFEASAGGGMVKAVAQGDNSLVSLTIDPEAVDPEDVEMLQDMITAAVNEALRGVAELGAQRINAATGGMSIPGLM